LVNKTVTRISRHGLFLTITVIRLLTVDVQKALAREFPPRLSLFWLLTEVLAGIVSPLGRTIANPGTQVRRRRKRRTRFGRLFRFRLRFGTLFLCGRRGFLPSWRGGISTTSARLSGMLLWAL
jgi:hypothetical protein